jgi:integrase
LDRLSVVYIAKLEDYWKNAKVKDMTAGAIRQSAIDIYPDAGGATRNRQVITPTQAIINHCAELELCPPVRIKRFKFEKKIKKPVTIEWLDKFCVPADKQMIALATFMFATGCRISEAMRLEWSDIDFQQRTILIRKTKNKKERLPNMPARLLVALANLPRETAPFRRPEITLRRAWDAVIEKASIERLTFHCCRHGFATKLLRDGIDPKTAAELGGWDSVSLFIETYAHAMKNARLTDNLFDTKQAHEQAATEQKQELK